MCENEIIDRIKYICNEKDWTYYRLAKESGIAYSTLCTMLHKSNAPSIPTLYKICSGFGITLSEFFGDDIDRLIISSEEKDLLKNWKALSPDNQNTIRKLMSFLLHEQ